MYKNPNKFIQFELWKDCKIGCKFCCNKGQPPINKTESLQFVLNKLDDDEVKQYNEIGFIGGEFFNDEIEDTNVKKMFYNIFQKISIMNFDKIYITTSLIFDISKYLIPFLDYLKELNILNKICLCTSYDIAYRFYTKERENNWKMNMLELHNYYPELKIHTEIILTQHFIDAVNNNLFSISKFQETYFTRIDYIEPSSGLYYKDKEECEKACPGFFPTKSSFVKFINKCVKNNEIDLETFLSMELRSNKLYFIENGEIKIADDRRNGDGRCLLKSDKKYDIGFIDSSIPMRDIVKEFMEIY